MNRIQRLIVEKEIYRLTDEIVKLDREIKEKEIELDHFKIDKTKLERKLTDLKEEIQ